MKRARVGSHLVRLPPTSLQVIEFHLHRATFLSAPAKDESPVST